MPEDPMTASSDRRDIQQIYRVTEEERAAFAAAAARDGLPLSYWVVQSCRAHAGMSTFKPAPRPQRPKAEKPPAEPKRRGRPPKAKPEAAAEPEAAPPSPRGKADPSVKARLAEMIAGATPPPAPRRRAAEVKP